MQTLRIVNVQVIDSSNISVTFTESLTPNLVTSNVSILPDTLNIPTPEVLQIKINKATLSITCQPMTPLASYYLQFQSVPLHVFESLNGDAIISMDGISNKYLIVAPLSPDNPVQQYLGAFYHDNIYNLDDPNTVIYKYIQSLSLNLSKALYDIRQVKNENYLSFTVTDERKIRGAGPFDRLNEEAAYEIIRVGRGPTTASATSTFSFDNFPSYPITLQREVVQEKLSANSVDNIGEFNINSLTLNLSSSPVSKLNSVIFTFTTSPVPFTYDITDLGYQILDSRYDQDFGFTYQQLSNNQIRLSEKILSDPNFYLDNILRVDVQYEYKNLGIVVAPASVEVTTSLPSSREVLPPIINVFSLQHAPIVDSDGHTATLGGITFTDPNSSVPGAVHPAFVIELPYRLSALPFAPGQYSIDYATGQVYVYGADLNNDGTGPSPPLATYLYLFTYKSEIDYVYDPDTSDLVALPPGNLTDNAGTIDFNYEQVFIPNIDYNPDLHQEALAERIDNRLLAINVIQTVNSPITNVFRIYNETSGEIYTLDRWNDNKIYFRYNTPPRVIQQTGERATFTVVTNEILFVNTTLINSGSLSVFKIFLNNNTLASATEDTLSSSFNTSLVLSDGNVFVNERWFNREFIEADNINRLLNVGEYMVDYANGIIYVAVSGTQGFSIGTATYKNDSIDLQFPHIISADDIYYRISAIEPKNQTFAFTSFEDGSIVPEVIEPSDELFLNSNSLAPYQLLGGKIGIFYNASFVSGVTSEVKFVRSVFEYDDLLNSTNPINFSTGSTSNGFNIQVAPISKQQFNNIQHDIDGYFITVNENLPYLSPNITYTFSVVRSSDSAQLWDNSGVVVAGDPIKLVLSGINSPMVGDLVRIDYSFTINDLSRVVVDYNKGDLFVDYTYVADEVIISYEYGDNVIDFRGSHNIPQNTQYFVSYKVGALRDALLKNFGTLVNIPELSNFDVDFDRERYRDALTAALSSFIQGPTVNAIKNIGQIISHIEPEVIESIFQAWSLGTSLLYPESVTTTGAFELLPAKFGNGALINSSDQTISMPVNSNLRLEEGTFESWILPQWSGLDNDALLTFTITRNGSFIPPSWVFIGAAENHPTINNGTFTIDKNTNVVGTPNTNKDGVFIYYDLDPTGNFYRWYLQIIDGYVVPNNASYKFKVTSTGAFYDTKNMTLSSPTSITTFTGTNTLNLSIAADGYAYTGITFVSDVDHYLLDFGEEKSKNRLSIFKDASGYMNFRVFDKNKVSYTISADVSSWTAGDAHHISASWKLNSYNNRDEIHFFVDGFEVPNIIKYGQKLKPYLHEKFRTVDPEEIAGSTTKDILGANDLQIIAGSNLVSSSINFSAYNIFIGDSIFIDEIGFSTVGYTILGISGQTLTLSAPMPMTLTNGRFSINRTNFTITSEIDIYPNIAITTIHALLTGTDLVGTASSNQVSSGTNFTTSNILPGYSIKIDDGYASPVVYSILQVAGNTLTIDDNLPVSFSSTNFQIYSNIENEIPGVRALNPAYSISKDSNFNNILTVSNDVFANDLILIRTLGLNFRSVKKQYYVWSDGYENILRTNLPPPISLDEADINKIILPTTAIGPAIVFVTGPKPAQLPQTNISPVVWVSGQPDGYVYQPTNTVIGRTLAITIAGNNTDFTSPVQITIDGMSGASPASQTVYFSDYGTMDTNPVLFTEVNYVEVVVTPINASKNALTVTVKEKYPITISENNELVPVIKYSYPMGSGYNLFNDSSTSVRDESNLFSADDINNYLFIQSPPSVAGYYLITSTSADLKSLFIQQTAESIALPLPPFSNGIYQVLNVTDYRSGLQNGFFTFELDGYAGQPYMLSHGFYELDYSTYANIVIEPVSQKFYLGSNFLGANQLDGIIDQVKIYSTMLTDTRVGETIPSNQNSITKDFNSLKALKADTNTLVLLDTDNFPFINSARFYITPPTDTQHFQSSVVVNENFGESIVITDNPIVLSNDGILDTEKEGTLEFWVSPLVDTGNDPNTRFYFDAYGAVSEDAVSINNTTVKISAPASKILSVKLQTNSNIDYFAGGKLELDTQRAIQEESVSLTNSIVLVAKPILQVITVKIVGDLTGKDYFVGGSIGSDQKTIYLGITLPSNNLPLLITYQTTANKNDTLNTQAIRLNRKLPDQNSKVIVNYIPRGLQGDRLSLWKDEFGYVNFGISASGTDYVVRAPTRWIAGTWHRIKASYKINGGVGTDEIRLFLDGYEWSNVLFGTGLVFGSFPVVMGASQPGDGYGFMSNIKFKDPINELFIGSEYTYTKPIFSLIDNFRISNIARPIYAPYGEPLDVNYSSNLNVVFPVTSDLYTTYLLNFNSMKTVNDDFTILTTRGTGAFNFSVNILDSFGIVNSSIKVQEALEKLINVLKPANSQVFIEYTR